MPGHLQEFLFQRIKEKLAPGEALAEKVAELLHLSPDSAYRRIRGETPLILEEASLLSQVFGISLDQVSTTRSNSVIFQPVQLNPVDYSFEKYLADIHQTLKQLQHAGNVQLIYLCKDIPLFHLFGFRPLLAFRYFFWMKSVLQHPDFIHRRFAMQALNQQIIETGREICHLYNHLSSIEIWNTEAVNSLISQVEYYREADYFENPGDIDIIYTALRQTVMHIREQAEHGTKFLPEQNPRFQKENYTVFYNRIVLGDNTVLVKTNDQAAVYINYDVLDYIMTTDEKFCRQVQQKLQTLMRRSTLISTSSERQRNTFFNILLKKIPEPQVVN